ncbi:pR26 [rat cytomegalovirus strain Maastricht]|uniref:PR26 n=1 Tax=Rat cytomegalovirus (strain Maastricht) TaxID=79700 RepID=Q9DWG3_RCMVM|nr:pR26 [rat cytomegalovirus strain Maastricht]AAF99126.1 pR26 [rat cytomegalovirus strain Maastricht]WEG71951.1 tegument protein UL26 [Murid betaherpesvirus 2]
MDRVGAGRNGIFDRAARSESPYGASGVEICDLIVAAAVGPGALSRCVRRLRGIEIALPSPAGYVLFVGGEDDTILTPRDYQYWRSHPLMAGQLCVVGTIGYRHTLVWDRRVVAANGAGRICVYDMGPVCFISRVADDLVDFLAYGLPDEYIRSQGDARAGGDSAIVGPAPAAPYALSSPPEAAHSIIYSHWLPPAYTTAHCAPVDFEGVVRVGVPSERLLRGVRLGEEDLSDDLFKSAAVASGP